MAEVRMIGRFEIVRQLGRGGMAVVYLARQPGLDREVALKELASFHVEDQAFVDRFLRESRLAGSLSHPNIVTVYDFFEHEGVPYIAMEYLERGSLRPLVGHLSVAQVAGVMEGLLAGLNHAQSRSIVHRDLKPENLLVSDEGGIKIADFGIAKALNEVSMGVLTATGMAIGTPAYMSPEQATAGEIGPWTDLYTTGVIAYELFVGRVPFGGVDTPMAVLWKQVHEPPPAPLSVHPGLDPGLAGWLERMLAKTPADRPAGPAQAWEELEEIVIGLLGPRWRRDARLLERAPDAPTPEPLTPATFQDEVTPDTPVAARAAPAPPLPPSPEAAVPAPPPVLPPPPPEPVAAQPPSYVEQPQTLPPTAPPPPDESFVWPTPEEEREPMPPLVLGLVVLIALAAAAIAAILALRDGDGNVAATTTAQATTTETNVGGRAAFVRFRDDAGVLGGEGDQGMKSLVSTQGALLAAGLDGSGTEGDAALWEFRNGTWTRIAADALGGPGKQAIAALAGKEGTTVAVGWLQTGSDRDAATWTSTGDSFARTCELDSVCGDAAIPGPDRRQEMLGVAAAPSGFVAVGRDTDPAGGNFDAAVWRTADGLDWQRVPLPTSGFAGEGSQGMNDVVSTGTGLIAVGRDGLDAAVWRSGDGVNWERVSSDTLEAPGAQEMIAVIAGGPGLVVVGYEDGGGDRKRDAAVWTFDGVDWSRVAVKDLTATAGQEMRGIALSEAGLVAVGSDSASGERDAAIWTSPDGAIWTLLRDPELGGEGNQELEAVGPIAGATVAVGDGPSPVLSDQDAAVWTGGR